MRSRCGAAFRKRRVPQARRTPRLAPRTEPSSKAWVAHLRRRGRGDCVLLSSGVRSSVFALLSFWVRGNEIFGWEIKSRY